MDECFICSIITNIEPLNKKKSHPFGISLDWAHWSCSVFKCVSIKTFIKLFNIKLFVLVVCRLQNWLRSTTTSFLTSQRLSIRNSRNFFKIYNNKCSEQRQALSELTFLTNRRRNGRRTQCLIYISRFAPRNVCKVKWQVFQINHSSLFNNFLPTANRKQVFFSLVLYLSDNRLNFKADATVTAAEEKIKKPVYY